MADSPGLEKARILAREAASGRLYPMQKKDCAEQVVRWEWADSVLYSLEPAFWELYRYPLGLRITEDVVAEDGGYGYGFDGEGRLVVEHIGIPGRMVYETFYRWEASGTSYVHYGFEPEGSWLIAAWFSRDGEGRVVSRDAVYERGGQSTDLYHYDLEGRLVSVEQRTPSIPGDLVIHRDFEYGPKGKIIRVYRRVADGPRSLEFEKPSEDWHFPKRGRY